MSEEGEALGGDAPPVFVTADRRARKAIRGEEWRPHRRRRPPSRAAFEEDRPLAKTARAHPCLSRGSARICGSDEARGRQRRSAIPNLRKPGEGQRAES